jgi:alpha,alpha-trehalase
MSRSSTVLIGVTTAAAALLASAQVGSSNATEGLQARADTSGIVTIAGLKRPGTNTDMTIGLSKATSYLQHCLKAGTITQEQYNTSCLLPFINGMWTSPKGLLRQHGDIVTAAKDWLVKKPKSGGWPLYYPEGNAAARNDLGRLVKSGSGVTVKELPDPLPIPGTKAGRIYQNAGMLYLPNSYVVPGGIFNEMYGWDSYFIIKGLLASAAFVLDNPTSRYWNPGKQRFVTLNASSAKDYAARLFNLAKGMTDNHAFEINFYGGMVNNGNRIYYLTRSQPPLFASEARAVYSFARAHQAVVPYHETLSKYLGIHAPKNYRQWINMEILPAARTYFDYYTDPSHVIFNETSNPRVTTIGGRRVSLYVTDGVGPVPEITKSKVPGNKGYFQTVKTYFKTYPKANPNHRFMTRKNKLTQLYYRSDRAARASGYDLSGRFGYVGEWVAMYAPVDLQALLYQFGRDINKLIAVAKTTSQPVTTQAVPGGQLKSMRTTLRKVFWKGKGTKKSPSSGHWTDRFAGPGPNQPDPYLYATTLIPLWADGLTKGGPTSRAVRTAETPVEVRQEQLAYARNAKGKKRAFRLTSSHGRVFECAKASSGCKKTLVDTVGPLPLVGSGNYGMPMSQRLTGNQWDYPNAWAPVNFFASAGLRRHGFTAASNTLDRGWLNAVDVNFAVQGILVEKFVTTDPSEAPPVTAGYSANQAGFGWTNAYYMTAWKRQYG